MSEERKREIKQKKTEKKLKNRRRKCRKREMKQKKTEKGNKE